MSTQQLGQWLAIESFEYDLDGARFATLRISGVLRNGTRAPCRPVLVLRHTGLTAWHRPSSTRVHRRFGRRSSRARRLGARWTLTFRLPIELVERGRAGFELAAGAQPALPLPPVERAVTSGQRAFAERPRARTRTRRAKHTSAPRTRWLRQRGREATALAFAFALGAGVATATAALADSSPNSANPGASTTATSAPAGATTPAAPTATTTGGESTTSTTDVPSTPTTVQTSDTGIGSTTPNAGPGATGTTGTTDSGATNPSSTSDSATTTPTTTPPTTETSTTPAAGTQTSAPAPTTSQATTTISAQSVLRSTSRGSSALVVSGRVRRRNCTSTERTTQGVSQTRGTACATGVTRPTRGGTRSDRAHHAVRPPTPANLSPITFTPLGSGGSVGSSASPTLANPFSGPQLQLQFYQSLVGNINQPPRWLIPIYRGAAHRFHVPWQLLAAINRMETNYGTDLRISSAGAIGWMQFEPGTWAAYGMAVNRHLKPVAAPANPYGPRDAIFSAARYLHASGASVSVPAAVFAYNHASWYVAQVLSIAEQINQHGLRWNSSAHRKIAVMRTQARLLNGMPYVWGGGHGGWGISAGYDCSGFVSAVLHSTGLLRVPVTTQSLPGQRGILPGRGRWVTIYDRTDGGALNADHVIIRIKRQWWESGGSALSGGGDRVHRIPSRAVTAAYLGSFNLILHPWHL
jgi:hypothetical protein